MSEGYRLSRRDALKYAGAGLVATTFVGTTTAHGGAVGGAPESLGDGSAYAYVEYERGRGKPSAIGVHIDGDALDNLSATPEAYPLDLPRGNTGHFSYVGLDWNPAGHEPEGLYTHPHFDVHFYFPSESEVAGIAGGPLDYTIPPELLPPSTVHTNQLPAPQSAPRFAVPGMGEHLITLPSGPDYANSLPQAPGVDGWSVFIWGAYDMDGDGDGEMIFMEPMVTTKYLQRLANAYPTIDEVRNDIRMPERFHDGGWYPTEFVVAYDGSDYTISLESFEHFPGYDA